MATLHLADYTATDEWTNLVATLGATANADVVLQNTGKRAVQIVFGGDSAPTTTSGIILAQIDSVQGNAAKIWVRLLDAISPAAGIDYDGSAKISVATV